LDTRDFIQIVFANELIWQGIAWVSGNGSAQDLIAQNAVDHHGCLFVRCLCGNMKFQ
jgi:hypothetical protein